MKILSEEHKRKISEALKGRPKLPFTDEHRRNIGLSSKGHKRGLGRKHSKNTLKKMSASHIGLPSGNKGNKWSDETRDMLSGENHPHWIMDPDPEKHYVAIHKRIHRTYGKASRCEICGGSKCQFYEWSNKDHKYSMNRDDWQELCRSCHYNYDRDNGLSRQNQNRKVKH